MRVQTGLIYCTGTHASSATLPVIPAFLNKCHIMETKDLPSLLLLFDACSGGSFEVAIGLEKNCNFT